MATIKKSKGTQTLETADEEAPIDFTNMTAEEIFQASDEEATPDLLNMTVEELKALTKKTKAKNKALTERIKEERLAKKKEPK